MVPTDLDGDLRFRELGLRQTPDLHRSMLDIDAVMSSLARRRTLFHSEADFQHELAWELRSTIPSASVRLEIPIATSTGSLHLDCFIRDGDRRAAIELKYKTRKLTTELNGEKFNLLDQSAQDIGRYDFLNDIVRLERISSEMAHCEGYAILLTNDSAYWKAPASDTTVDAAFRLADARIVYGSLAWGEMASAGTKRDREQALIIRGTYKLAWRVFATPFEGRYGVFRYLAVRVGEV